MELIDMLAMLLSAGSMVYMGLAFMDAPPPLDIKNVAEDPSARAAAAIREIEFDYSAGKLSKEDFETVRNQTIAELAAAIKKQGLKRKD